MKGKEDVHPEKKVEESYSSTVKAIGNVLVCHCFFAIFWFCVYP